MPDSHNRSDTNYAKYDAMSTEELQQLLREDASKPEGEDTNMEVLLYVMDVLAKRRQARNEGRSPEEALESFMQNYYEEDDKSSSSESVSADRKQRLSIRRWMSGLIAAAAMFAIILSTSLTAKAFGFDLWEIIVKWTQETFHFGYSGEVLDSGDSNREDSMVYAGLQAALDDFDISANIVPTWFPEGYEEIDIRTFETPKQRQFVASYKRNDDEIKIWIADYLDADPSRIEQSDATVEVYIVSGVEYYIVADNGQLRAAWVVDRFECYISGPLSVEELKEMINSIGKG